MRMQRRGWQGLWLLLAVLLMTVGGAQGQTAPATRGAKVPGLLWKLTSPTTTVYLLGSVHLAAPDLYPLPGEIEAAFQGAQVLAVEVDLTKLDQTKMAALVAKMGMYDGDDTLDKHVSAQGLKALQDYCQAHHLPVETFSKFRPWMAGMTVMMLAFQEDGLDPELGVDKHFMDKAKGKRIMGMETAEDQLKLMAGLNAKQQESVLLAATKEAAKLKEEMAKVVAAWKAGDAEKIEALMREANAGDVEDKALLAKLIDERSVGMARQVETLLQGKEQAFVVVGTAHVVGEKGILKLLNPKDLKVERVMLTMGAKP